MHNTGTTWLQKKFFPYIDKIVVSNENFSGIPWLGTGVEYRDALIYGLKKLYPDGKIIIGIRNPYEWINSMYCHYVKRGCVYSFSYWKDNVFDNRHMDLDNYIVLIKLLFKEVFIYDFKDFKRDKERVLEDMCNFIGCRIPVYEDVVINKGWYGNKTILGLKFNRMVGKMRYIIDKI